MTTRFVGWESRCTGSIGAAAACFTCPASFQPISPCRSKHSVMTVGDYVDRLHTAIVLVLEEFDLTGHLPPGVPGVFSGQARIATVGVAVTRWIAYHGLTFNVGPYLEIFQVLDEPAIGQGPLRNTSMEARRQRHTAMSKVREALVRRLEEVFGVERHHVYTHHPMINGKVFSHVYAPTPGLTRSCRA